MLLISLKRAATATTCPGLSIQLQILTAGKTRKCDPSNSIHCDLNDSREAQWRAKARFLKSYLALAGYAKCTGRCPAAVQGASFHPLFALGCLKLETSQPCGSTPDMTWRMPAWVGFYLRSVA